MSFTTIVQHIKALENQKMVVSELRKQPMYISGISEIKKLNENEFKTIYKNFLNLNMEINKII